MEHTEALVREWLADMREAKPFLPVVGSALRNMDALQRSSFLAFALDLVDALRADGVSTDPYA